MKEFCLFHLEKAIGASMMHQFVTPSKTIISQLSFTHLRKIVTLLIYLAMLQLHNYFDCVLLHHT